MRPASAARAVANRSPQPESESGTLPRIVAIGGGTGLPNVLRGLRPLLYGTNRTTRESAPRDRLVAIVATSDDGGSSGKLRAEFNIIPPG
ncbi:MAG: 2-phospho-L-lactate transferase CofD family protein, partial [Acidobacteriota bacterium]